MEDDRDDAFLQNVGACSPTRPTCLRARCENLKYCKVIDAACVWNCDPGKFASTFCPTRPSGTTLHADCNISSHQNARGSTVWSQPVISTRAPHSVRHSCCHSLGGEAAQEAYWQNLATGPNSEPDEAFCNTAPCSLVGGQSTDSLPMPVRSLSSLLPS
jgi:hypothetical protein